MTRTPSTERPAPRLPVPRPALLELGLTDEQVDEALAAAPLVVACQADRHPDAWFDVDRAKKALRALGAFKHTKGRWAGVSMRLGEGLDPWQVVWILAPIFGWVYYDAEIDRVVRVVRAAYIEVPRKAGKGLYTGEMILTRDGWKKFGDLVPGDQVHAVDGSLTEVTWISPVRELDCYRVTFGDGQSIVCDADHQWTVWDRYGHDPQAHAAARASGGPRAKGAWRTLQTPELAMTHRCGARGDTRYSVQMDRVLQRPEQHLPMDPYLLGAWLGDGHTDAARITTIDEPIWRAFEAPGYIVRRIPGTVSYAVNGGFKVALRELGVLGDKHVPEPYLIGSAEQRLALLQGLMDTDGGVIRSANTPRVEFCSTKQVLAEAVLFLARSLGWKATCAESRAMLKGRDVGPRWRVSWTAFSDRPPFRLERKVRALHASPARPTRSSTNTIVNIERVPTVPTMCISVDHPSCQFLAGPGLIPTHNSTLSSGISGILLLADGEAGAEVYNAAGSTLQAGRVFEDAKRMLLTSPAARKRVEPLKEVVRVPATGSILRVLSRVAETAHGLNVSGAIIDELHTLRLRRALVEAIETGTGARDQPLIVMITTADEAEDGTVYDEKHRYTRNVALGIVNDPGHYGVIWAAEPSDDPHDERTWRKANPGLGKSPTLAYMRRESEKARTTPTYFPTFCRLSLNLRMREQTRWLDVAKWDTCAGEVDRPALARRRAWGGLDLSAVSDFTAWAVFVESEQPGVALELMTRFWVPEERVEDLERRLQVPLRRWVQQGLVEATEGDVIDYTAVKAAVIGDCRHLDMRRISYDRMFAGQMVQELDAELDGVEVATVNQTFLGLSPACKELERLIGAGRLRHAGSPVMRWMADVVEVKNDGNDNIRPVKPDRQKAIARIDGVQAAVTALDGWVRGAGLAEHDNTVMVFRR